MSEQSEAPKKIWLEYTPHEQHLHLTDELVWTGHLTEYVRADYHERLVEALERLSDVVDAGPEYKVSMAKERIAAIEQARALLAALEAEKGGEL